MKLQYKIIDKQGEVLAKGNQLELRLTLDLSNQEFKISNGVTCIVCDVASNDAFTIQITRQPE